MIFIAEEQRSDSRGTKGYKMPPPKGPLRDRTSARISLDEGKFILEAFGSLQLRVSSVSY